LTLLTKYLPADGSENKKETHLIKKTRNQQTNGWLRDWTRTLHLE